MSSPQNSPQGFWSMMGFGSLFFLVGAFIVMLAADIIPSDPSSFNAPRWVVGGAGMVFMLAGAMAALQGAFGPNPEESKLYLWIILMIGTAFMLIFSSIFLWVGFGPGEREFSSSTSIGIGTAVTTTNSSNDTTGRLVFGGGGLISLLMTFAMAHSNWKKIRNFDG